MNSSEKRRKLLLERTRRLYRDGRETPAIHPRYGAIYHHLYEDPSEKELYPAGTFGIRLMLCVLLFAAFVTMDRQEYSFLKIDSGRIMEEIATDNIKIADVWKNL